MEPKEFDRTYKTNVYAMFYLCRTAISKMPSGGSIIATASVQAFQPSGQLLAYSSTKGAIRTFIQALAELAMEKGNPCQRGRARAGLDSADPLDDAGGTSEEFGKNTLIGRAAQPAELAPTFVFLASNDAGYITGSVVDVTGGRQIP